MDLSLWRPSRTPVVKMMFAGLYPVDIYDRFIISCLRPKCVSDAYLVPVLLWGKQGGFTAPEGFELICAVIPAFARSLIREFYGTGRLREALNN